MRTKLCFTVLFVAMLPIAGICSDLVLSHAKIYTSPTEPPVEDGVVLIHNGRITAVGPSSTIKAPHFARAVTTIDCHGMTVTAGFWNSHVHIFTAELLDAEHRSSAELAGELKKMFLRRGFTTVFDTASVLANTNNIRNRIAKGEIEGPRIFTVGDPFYPQGGTPVYIKGFLEQHHIPSAEVSSPEEAVARVRRQIEAGADGAKIFAGAIVQTGVVPMPLDIAKAIVAETHRHGKPVFAHPSDTQGLEVSLQSGVDILAHTAPMSGDWSPAFVQRLKDAHMALIPTLTLFDVEADKAGVSSEEKQQWLRQASQELKAYSEAGGEILFGTDAGYIDRYDTTEEFQLMARAGMSYQHILASLTTNPAKRFGLANKSGRIAKGMDADLVVLNGDPAQDVTAFSKVRYAVRAGKLIYSLRGWRQPVFLNWRKRWLNWRKPWHCANDNGGAGQGKADHRFRWPAFLRSVA
ncbi:MAG TPA: amidohydrolase family protein [Candidatus Limnocylindrales bacterium]|nr:amidohydrolase family protein [Candidatus Limnocylindrales bacterium]